MIDVLRGRDYPGSPLTIEQTLEPGDNYDRYVASYLSDGLKLYALLTVPRGARPEAGWPIIVFNHGYVPPDEYETTARYVQYVDYFARSGYIVFRSDYRGHGDSEGEARGPYSNSDYVIDVLNGLAAVRTHPDADPDRVGMWGHSMGGYITLRAMVIADDVAAGVIWGGVVAPYPDLFNRAGAVATAVAADPPAVTATQAAIAATQAAIAATQTVLAQTATPPFRRGRWRNSLIDAYGAPEENPAFWASINAQTYLADLSGPLQLHHAITDETVPAAASTLLYDLMTAAGLPVELYLYDNDSHDIDNNFYTAMSRSLAFFDQHVKQ
jgi:dipeptidyl aminopeptidase/acylaminoacyl peptidase